MSVSTFTLRQWEIVQLNPEKCRNPMFSGCLMVVDEVKPWGAQGYVQALGKDEKPGGQAYYRAKWEEIVITGGMARFVPTYLNNTQHRGFGDAAWNSAPRAGE